MKKTVFKNRDKDWRLGNIVYQVLVDRFSPSANLEEKKKAYLYPRKLKQWNDLPTRGHYLEDARVWSHEVDFWGGDLKSLSKKLDYIQDLKVDVLYLNPIFSSLTNHKYDTWDYTKVDPLLGTRKDLKALTKKTHSLNMKIILDGVFNHMGASSPFFLEAQQNIKSSWRKFFRFSDESPTGYIGWMDAHNLPELNLENAQVRNYIYKGKKSIVQSYLKEEGIDGWRLDVAGNLGHQYLKELTQSAHAAKKDSVIIGEIWSYPQSWFPSIDGIMNMHGRRIIFGLIEGQLTGKMATQLWETMIQDAGIENLLKSWLILDNHDTPRLTTLLKTPWMQNMARLLQFTLPGCVCLYYGSELGMEGGADPEQRAPMRWDLTENNPTLAFYRKLIALRKSHRALRLGDYVKLHSENLMTFLRVTDLMRETVMIVANPSSEHVRELIQIREGRIQDSTIFKDAFSNREFTLQLGMLDLEIAPHSFYVLVPQIRKSNEGFDPHSRIV